MMKLTTLAAGVALAAAFDERMNDWNLEGRADASTRIRWHVAMPMANFGAIESRLAEVSNPQHADYGKWMTKDQVDVFAKPLPEVVAEVTAWATSTGAECTLITSALRCTATVGATEALLSTTLSSFSHKTTPSRKIVRLAAGVGAVFPPHLTGKVLFLSGLTQFPVPRLGRLNAHIPDADNYIVPSTITKMYNVAIADGSLASKQAAVEFQNYPAPLPNDISIFVKNTAIPGFAFNSSNTIGPYQAEAGADESTLDVMYLAGAGQGNNNWYWTESDWQYEFAQDASQMSDDKIPKVLSISYAWYELQQCEISPQVAPCTGTPNITAGSIAFVTATNQLYAAIGLRGISMLSASGDSGAHGRSDSGCQFTVVRPDYPAASPYITAVGGTRLTVASETSGGSPEPVCSSTIACATGGHEVCTQRDGTDGLGWATGGGFSTFVARPSWQDAVVSTYLMNASANPGPGNFNANGRGFPDVAALAHKYYIVMSGQTAGVDGTSAATPAFAGLVGSLNAWRLAAGKPTLGFLNPLLYQIYAANPAAFNDVTEGNNVCSEYCCPKVMTDGYFATTGWDATTGLGTPNYGLIKAQITAWGI